MELIAHLALHPNGVTGSQLKTAIWPDTIPSQDTFNVPIASGLVAGESIMKALLAMLATALGLLAAK